MFMHGGWLHLGGNMLYLWIFGDNVEDRFGHFKFLLFYLLAGIAATFAQYYVMPGSNVPNVGASGAIAGVLGAYILMFPQARVNVLVGNQMVAMPALIVLGLWIALQLFSGVGSIAYTDETTRDVGGVAYMAHVGGFVAGLLDDVPVPRQRRQSAPFRLAGNHAARLSCDGLERGVHLPENASCRGAGGPRAGRLACFAWQCRSYFCCSCCSQGRCGCSI